MNFLSTNQVVKSEVGQFATSENFGHVFIEDMADFYQVSFLLTADHDKAEQCFIAGVEDCVKTYHVFSVKTYRAFREWARSWAKLTIVQKAIRTLEPRPNNGVSSAPETVFSESEPTTVRYEHLEVNRVLAMEPFERFVFVMSVLERYSEHDCTLLLGCSTQDFRRARVRALGQLVGSDCASSARDSLTNLQETAVGPRCPVQ